MAEGTSSVMSTTTYDILKYLFTSLIAIVSYFLVLTLKGVNDNQKELARQLASQGDRLLKIETEHSLFKCNAPPINNQ